MKPTLLLVVLLVTAAPIAVAGQDDAFTGHTLLTRCESFVEAMGDASLTRGEWFSAGVCTGLVRAASVTAAVSQAINFCVPDPQNIDEQVHVVIQFLNDHPEKLDEPDFALVLEALGAAFPCS